MKKFFKWFKSAGLRSFGYGLVGTLSLVFGLSLIAFVCLGVFFIDNIVTIKKLIQEKAA
jgi:hypothetical protein